MAKIRILIVDDAVVVRRMLADCLAADPDIEIAGVAANGRIALSMIEQVNPQLVTLDIEMPVMDGLATLAAIRKLYPRLAVIMFSTLTERGATATFEALARGANDYVTKPANVGSVGAALQQIRDELIPKIKALCWRIAPAPASVNPAPNIPARPRPEFKPASQRTVSIVGIGVSTGGPNALAALLPGLTRELPVPVAIVQHMPPLFTRLLAERLTLVSGFPTREGAAGELLRAGEIWVAPGAKHLMVERTNEEVCLRTHEGPLENSCRPAVDVLFRSIAAAYGARALVVILTGMGQDGLRGCEAIREAGGQVLAQDEASSVVWGMPGAVVAAGLADKVLPLSELAAEINRLVAVKAPTALTASSP